MLKATQWLLPILLVVGLLYLGYRYWQVQNIAKKYDEAAEIASASLSKSGAVWTIRMESLIAQPPDKVWAALRQPERMAELQPEAFKKSVLQKEEGSKKTLEYQMALLSLPVQTLQAELTYDDAAKKARVVTSKGMQDIDATYELQPAGEKTRLIFAGTATDKVSVPIPQSVIEGALRELFVVQVRAIKKATGGDTGEKKFVETKSTGTGSICGGQVAKSGLKQVTMTVAKPASAPPAASGAPEFRNQTAGGYERGYVVDGVPVRETFESSTRCTTAKAVTGGGLEVEIQSVTLAPESLESWVRGIKWKELAALPADADEKKVLALLPDPFRGWEAVSPIDAPPLPSPIAHRAYQQQTF